MTLFQFLPFAAAALSLLLAAAALVRKKPSAATRLRSMEARKKDSRKISGAHSKDNSRVLRSPSWNMGFCQIRS